MIVIIAASALFLTIGEGANKTVCWLCLAVFYAVFVAALRRPVAILPGLPSYATIELFFLTFGYLLFFWPYQQYVLGMQQLDTSSFVHGYTFPEQTDRSLLLSTIAVVAFSWGVRRNTRPRNSLRLSARPYATNLESVIITVALAAQLSAMAVYFAAGWRSSGEGRYTGSDAGGAVADGVNTLILMFCMIGVALAVSARARNRPLLYQTWISLAASALWAIRILLLGDRNSFLLLALVAISGFLTYRVRTSRLILAGMLVIGLSMYNGVQAVRASGHVSIAAVVAASVSGDSSRAGAGHDSSFDITTIGARAATAVVPEITPYGYGKYKILGVLGIFPLLRGQLIGSWSDRLQTSTDVLTDAVIGPTAGWTIGTNVVSDVYVDFGVLGVIFALFNLGLLAGWLERRTMRAPADPRVAIMYLLSVSLFAELPRYAIDFPIRMLVWGALFVAFCTWIARPRVGRRKSGNGGLH